MAMVSREGSGESANPNSPAANTWYRVRILAKGANVTVWRGEGDDGPMAQVLSTTSAPTLTPASMWFISGASAAFAYDDIEVVADGWTSDTTFATNAGNELTSSTFGGVTTTYGYDAWGNMTSKARGSYSATYAWHYGGKLTSVTSTFPGEGTVTYTYGGDGKRRERDAGSSATGYKWNLGWDTVSTQDGVGTLATTDIRGTEEESNDNINPLLASSAFGSLRYHCLDGLGSTRSIRDPNGSRVAQAEYSPYGAIYSFTSSYPVETGSSYTGKTWDQTGKAYYTFFRYYDPFTARWRSRDPLGADGGTNLYSFVRANPTTRVDPLGLDYLTFDRYSEELRWIFTEKRSVPCIRFVQGSFFTTSCRIEVATHVKVWMAFSALESNEGRRDGPIPRGTYYIEPEGRHYPDIDHPVDSYGTVRYHIRRTLWTYIKNTYIDLRSGGFWLHTGATSNSTLGCIRFEWRAADAEEAMLEFDVLMQEYGKKIYLYVN